MVGHREPLERVVIVKPSLRHFMQISHRIKSLVRQANNRSGTHHNSARTHSTATRRPQTLYLVYLLFSIGCCAQQSWQEAPYKPHSNRHKETTFEWVIPIVTRSNVNNRNIATNNVDILKGNKLFYCVHAQQFFLEWMFKNKNSWDTIVVTRIKILKALINL